MQSTLHSWKHLNLPRLYGRHWAQAPISLPLRSSQLLVRTACKRQDVFPGRDLDPSCCRSWFLKLLDQEKELCSWILMGNSGLLLQRYLKGECKKRTVKGTLGLGGARVRIDRAQRLPNSLISCPNPSSSFPEALPCLSSGSLYLHSLASRWSPNAVFSPWHMRNESCFDKTNIFKRMSISKPSTVYFSLKHKGTFSASVEAVIAVKLCRSLLQRVWHNLDDYFQHLSSCSSSGISKKPNSFSDFRHIT